MEVSIFFGGSVVAAVVAGMIALFAPCCISFMLPAYFASAFQNRRTLLAMTFLFAAGVATIILPIALGASLLRQLLTPLHPAVYVTGGVLMLGLAAYILLGGTIYMPMPGRRAGGGSADSRSYGRCALHEVGWDRVGKSSLDASCLISSRPFLHHGPVTTRNCTCGENLIRDCV